MELFHRQNNGDGVAKDHDTPQVSGVSETSYIPAGTEWHPGDDALPTIALWSDGTESSTAPSDDAPSLRTLSQALPDPERTPADSLGDTKPYRNDWDRFRNTDLWSGARGDFLGTYASDSPYATQICPQCHGSFSPGLGLCPMCLHPAPGAASAWLAARPGADGTRELNRLKRRSRLATALQYLFPLIVAAVLTASTPFLRPIETTGRFADVWTHLGVGYLMAALALFVALCGEPVLDPKRRYLHRPPRVAAPRFRRGDFAVSKEVKAVASWLAAMAALIGFGAYGSWEYIRTHAAEFLVTRGPFTYFPADDIRAALVRDAIVPFLACLAVAVLDEAMLALSPVIEYYPAPVSPTAWRNIQQRRHRRGSRLFGKRPSDWPDNADI